MLRSIKSTISYLQTAWQKCHALCLLRCSPVCNIAGSHSCCPSCMPASAPLSTCSITAAVSELPVYVALLTWWQSLSCCCAYAACRATGCPPCVHLRLLSHLQCNSTIVKCSPCHASAFLSSCHLCTTAAKSGMLLAMMQHHTPAVCNDACCLHLRLRQLSSHLSITAAVHVTLLLTWCWALVRPLLMHMLDLMLPAAHHACLPQPLTSTHKHTNKCNSIALCSLCCCWWQCHSSCCMQRCLLPACVLPSAPP